LMLKLGGSVITVKEKPHTPDKRAIMRLAGEIKRANVGSLVIVHGGGSYGHPIAKKYRIKNGYRDATQILGFSETHQAMVSLNKMVLDALIRRRIPAVTVQPSAFIITDHGRIRQMEMGTVLGLLDRGFTPVLYGDAVLDSALGFTILSGDQLVSRMALELRAERMVVGIDVDGLYTADPKVDPSARLIPRVTPGQLEGLRRGIGGAGVTDVTGGMLGKVLELVPAVEGGIPAIIVNAAKPDNVYRALRGEAVVGTVVEAGGGVA